GAEHARRAPAWLQAWACIRSSLATAWARLVTSSLLKMLFMWFFTVNSLMSRIIPISGFVLPIATQTMIWRSRSDNIGTRVALRCGRFTREHGAAGTGAGGIWRNA